MTATIVAAVSLVFTAVSTACAVYKARIARQAEQRAQEAERRAHSNEWWARAQWVIATGSQQDERARALARTLAPHMLTDQERPERSLEAIYSYLDQMNSTDEHTEGNDGR